MRCDAVVCGTSDGDACNALETKDMDKDVTDPTAPRSIGKCTRDAALLRAYTPTQFKVKESSRAVRGAFRGSRAEQLCGLRLAALHKGTFFPLSTWSMYTYMVMYGRTWTRAAREQRSLGKFPAVTPRLAVSVRPRALVVSRLVTSKSSHPAAQKPIHLPEPLCPKSAGNQPTSCRAQESKEVGECCFDSQPSSWPFAQLPTHPSPNSFAAPAGL